MNANRSLADYIDMPIIVGDPDGRAVYVNPAFETDFLAVAEEAVGQPLANLFDGGGREALLRAVALVCDPEGKQTTRFGLMAGDRGYRAHVSAVESEGGRVGVILLLVRESRREERRQAFRREVTTPLDELTEIFDALSLQAEGASEVVSHNAAADGHLCVERIRKWASDVAASLNED